ncbi:HD domain-containing protein [Vibrio owensii]|uniref:HD domain-containing protein n=1 Tax=Vibrio owensii TaxID=696485 RepID=UPI003CC6832C
MKSCLQITNRQKSFIESNCLAFKLALHGEHGVGHWLRVLRNGIDLSKKVAEVDLKVVFWFSLLHDIERENENHDPAHGERAAKKVRENLDILDLTESQSEKLMKACEIHSKGTKSDDPTIAVCIDSDKLDLARVRIYPDVKYLSLTESKDEAFIKECNARAVDWEWQASIEQEIGIDLKKIISDKRLRKYLY